MTCDVTKENVHDRRWDGHTFSLVSYLNWRKLDDCSSSNVIHILTTITTFIGSLERKSCRCGIRPMNHEETGQTEFDPVLTEFGFAEMTNKDCCYMGGPARTSDLNRMMALWREQKEFRTLALFFFLAP
jgi:hypothetical protein